MQTQTQNIPATKGNGTASTATHAPLPWAYDGDAIRMAGGVGCVAMMATDCGDPVTREDAVFIVRAVNNHDALMAALKDIVENSYGPVTTQEESIWEKARQTIAAASI